MRRNFRKIAVVSLILTAFSAQAQPGTSSPYSLSGLGELKYVGFVDHQNMGGLSRAYRSSSNYSVVNPASYSALRSAVYNVGMFSSMGTLSTSDESTSVNNGNLSYASLAFSSPYKQQRHWGVSLGLYQSSNVGYDLRIENNDTFNSYNLFRGKGGINTFYVGGGIELVKGLSVGVNVNYNFGNIQALRAQIFPDTNDLFSLSDESHVSYGGFNFDFGVQYTVQTGGLSHTLGATWHSGGQLSGEGYRLAQTFYGKSINTSNGIVYIDTVLYEGAVERLMDRPVQLGFSYVLSDPDHWSIGVEYEIGQWSQIISDLNGLNYNNSDRLSVGVSWVPSSGGYKDKGDFFKKINYTAGFRYENLYYNFFGEQLNEIGISFGLGLPIVKTFQGMQGKVPLVNRVNVGFEYSTRGTTENNLIHEEYYHVRVGLNFNDKWFLKRKYQ